MGRFSGARHQRTAQHHLKRNQNAPKTGEPQRAQK
jgi:hypothetical protein